MAEAAAADVPPAAADGAPVVDADRSAVAAEAAAVTVPAAAALGRPSICSADDGSRAELPSSSSSSSRTFSLVLALASTGAATGAERERLTSNIDGG